MTQIWDMTQIRSVPQQSARERGLKKEVLVYLFHVSNDMAMYEQLSQ